MSADRVPFDDPILIGGLAHSGKTQLRIALGAHPDLSMTRRSYLWKRHFGRYGDLAVPANLDACLAAVAADPKARVLEPDVDRVRRELGPAGASYARVFGALHAHHAQRLGKRRWGEQLGVIEHYADPIFATFPSARMIHMVRDPRARQAEGTRGRRPRPGSVGWETARWRCSAGLAERNRGRYAEQYLVVLYEEFAADPEAMVRRVCAFVGEDVVPDVTDALATVAFDEAGAGTAAPDLPFVDRYAGNEMAHFGYRTGTASRAPLRVLRGWPANRAGMAAWRVLKRPDLARTGGVR